MPLAIRAESEKALTASQELALLRAAFQRTGSPDMRHRLAKLLLLEEHFSEIIDLFSAGDTLEFRDALFLTLAYLSKESRETDELARAAANRALSLAKTDVERAAALADRAKCESRLGDTIVARATLHQALALDPHNRNACKRLAAIELASEEPGAVVALGEGLLSKGVGHARLFGALSLANARSGKVAAAKAADGFDAFHRTEQLAPPPGWGSIEEFNAALAQELLAHPGMRYERYGSASTLTWRIENPARSDTPLFKALLGQIIANLTDRIAELGDASHPWAAAVPRKAFLRNWCVITEGEGFETWHVHQFGWLSGVYYVQIPDAIAKGTAKDGCLAFGLPDDLAGSDGAAAFGEHLVRPQPGLLMTFPSQCYHRTYPHGTSEKRICVAFDLRPE